MITVVAPVFNEAEVLPEFFERLGKEAERWGSPYEVILIDDGSTDDSWECAKRFHESNPQWKAVKLGRNFGHQTAIASGLQYARGDCVIVMDSDLQDPPEEIHRLIEKWREGYHVAFAVRTRRKEGLIKRACYSIFYRLMDLFASVRIPLGAGDFCAMDRRVVDLLNSMPERNRFNRGLRAWVGFKQIGVPYERGARAAGEVKYSYPKLIGLALDGIFSFSTLPLRAATIVGFTMSILSFFAALFYFLTRIFSDFFREIGFPPVPGFATVVIAIFFLGGVQLLFLGIAGEYIARIYDEVKARPISTTMEMLGFDPDEAKGN